MLKMFMKITGQTGRFRLWNRKIPPSQKHHLAYVILVLSFVVYGFSLLSKKKDLTQFFK
ncbi:Uncharacterized protein TCM_011570 [Theobroma cacao]|uniref:Uncharacterized protein n=1 Tax=Theobroma cacao TaxID=3641 RepID=A0A061EAW1_THECC|nr:Uncharacterized protein TCM_011570 [Theobroma cacao]